jgi:RNA polymerase sigma factor (sigma-70 family)
VSQAACIRRDVAGYGRRRSGHERELEVLVRAARAGDPDASTRLVQRFDGMLRGLARSYRLAPSDVDDVVQQTWLVLFEAIDQVREPAAIGAWLATTLRRVALRRIQLHVREHLTDDPQLGDTSDAERPAETRLLALERHAALTSALSSLPERQGDLLRILFTQPTLGYRNVANLLRMPIGSIGPTRARSLARLARDAQLRQLCDAMAGPPARRSD